MRIAIRKNGEQIYIDKEICSKTNEDGERFISDDDLKKEPYNYSFAEISDDFADCEACDFDLNLKFNEQKYNDRKNAKIDETYKKNIEKTIRSRYSLNDELAILRQKDTKPSEFREYFDYVEQAKLDVKDKMAKGENLWKN